MCKECGCDFIIAQGPEATLARVAAIIKELGVTPENAQAFEDGERICGLIASKQAGAEDQEVAEIAEWFGVLHRNTYGERNRSYARAAREVFANFPAQGSPREIITTWHQLEQLCRELGDDAISAVADVTVREAVRAVNCVHDNPQQRRAELLKRYGLQAP